MGISLAKRIQQLRPDHGIQVVVPIPETSRPSALECASFLQVPYRDALIKNRYIARTFIMPGQSLRQKGIHLKLNAIKPELEGKVVLLVDDSIVRGNTAKEIINMVRAAGASKIFFASAAPPVRYPNVYGIDMPTFSELVAHEHDENEISSLLGADWVIYNQLSDVEDAVKSLNPEITALESSCFSGEYVTGDVGEEYLLNLQNSRNEDRHVFKRQKTGSIIDLLIASKMSTSS